MPNKEVTIKLLLVDDEEEFRRSASKVLERMGFSVRQATGGEQALERIQEEVPDVIVLDLRMEGLDGIATLERIRESFGDLPVVILTGHGRYEDALAGIQMKVIDFVQKPVDIRHLGERIREYLKRDEHEPLREKSIGELMVPESAYRRVNIDQSVQEVVEVLHSTQHRLSQVGEADRGRRTLLVFDDREQFVGLIRAEDMVRAMIPAYLLESPYSSYFTGMFLAQTKVMGKLPIRHLIRDRPSVDVDAALMEAVYLMVAHHVSHLPVTRDGKLVGILRPEDLFPEIVNPILGA